MVNGKSIIELKKENDLFIPRESVNAIGRTKKNIKLLDYQLFMLGHIPNEDEEGFVIKLKGELIVVIHSLKDNSLRPIDVDLKKILI